YHRWAEELVPLARGITEGAAKNGARLVALDNLYMYRIPADGRLAESTPVGPVSRKGALRAEAAAVMRDAHPRAHLPVALGRAPHQLDPRRAVRDQAARRPAGRAARRPRPAAHLLVRPRRRRRARHARPHRPGAVERRRRLRPGLAPAGAPGRVDPGPAGTV